MRWVVVLVLALTGCAAAPSPSPAPDPGSGSGSGRDGVVHASASCAFSYGPERLAAQTDFALDATVTALPPPGGTDAVVHVNAWLRGGDGSTTTTLPLGNPSADSGVAVEDTAPYELGDRLLVSGASAEDDSPLVWRCGFTRPWRQAAYDEWRASLG